MKDTTSLMARVRTLSKALKKKTRNSTVIWQRADRYSEGFFVRNGDYTEWPRFRKVHIRKSSHYCEQSWFFFFFFFFFWKFKKPFGIKPLGKIIHHKDIELHLFDDLVKNIFSSTWHCKCKIPTTKVSRMVYKIFVVIMNWNQTCISWPIRRNSWQRLVTFVR